MVAMSLDKGLAQQNHVMRSDLVSMAVSEGSNITLFAAHLLIEFGEASISSTMSSALSPLTTPNYADRYGHARATPIQIITFHPQYISFGKWATYVRNCNLVGINI